MSTVVIHQRQNSAPSKSILIWSWSAQAQARLSGASDTYPIDKNVSCLKWGELQLDI